MSLYFIERCILHIKKNGFLSFINNGFHHLTYIANPKKIGELPFSFFFKKKRMINRRFIKKNLLKFDHKYIERYFNYYLDTSKIDSSPVVYTFGIGGQIKFEEVVANRFKDAKIFTYDPTSKNFIDNYTGPKNINLFPYGLYTKDEKIKFYYTDNLISGSISNLYESKNKSLNIVKHQCYKLKTLMKMNNHYKLDILKIDIEGIAIEVLEDIFNDDIFPNQIVVEFEFSSNDNLSSKQITEFNSFELKLLNLLKKMQGLNYKAYNMPRLNTPYSSIEVLFVKT